MLETIPIHIESETGDLKSVVIGSAETLDVGESEISHHLRESKKKGDIANKDRAIEEFENFKYLLKKWGVQVFTPLPLKTSEQMNTRDIAYGVGGKLIISNMKAMERQNEIEGIRHVIQKIDHKKIVHPSQDIFTEGGDIIVDGGVVFIGYGNRTEGKIKEWIENTVIEDGKKILPVYMNQPVNHEVLHLDCCFMPIGNKSALIWKKAFSQIPQEIHEHYKNIIPVTDKEQDHLGTNVFSINPETVFSRDAKSSKRINKEMRKIGLNVVSIPFDENPKTGGSLRCATLPLERR